MQLCAVCSEQVPKYRCPVCRVRYCSLGCFKKHKSDIGSCQPVENSAPTVCTPVPNTSQNVEEPWTVHDLLDEDCQSDRVPLQKLQQLGQSKALLGLLQNPHLRNLMRTVDSAEDKAKVMMKAMQEPLFVEFANQCLQIIEPSIRGHDDSDDE